MLNGEQRLVLRRRTMKKVKDQGHTYSATFCCNAIITVLIQKVKGEAGYTGKLYPYLFPFLHSSDNGFFIFFVNTAMNNMKLSENSNLIFTEAYSCHIKEKY